MLRYEDERPFRAGVADVTSASVIEPHAHDYYELLWLVSGSGDHVLDDQARPLQRGTLVLVRPGDRHSVRGEFRFAVIEVSRPAWTDACTEAGINPQAWDAASGPVELNVDAPSGDRAVEALVAGGALREFLRATLSG